MRFSESRFRHPWREYQARILSEFDRHVTDGRFHVVAAPGSGKTILGLEAVRRLDRPALVCAPTLTLRGQWLERLTTQFLDGARPDWVSEEITAPGWLTLATYQGLHARVRAVGAASLAGALARAGVSVLVLDEAHHLKQEWWRALDAVVAGMEGAFVVALTATPPYDVPQAEWNRYLRLAGPIDAEVGAAELVRTGDLCPHQDYVYVQRPTRREEAKAQAFHEAVRSLLSDLALDRELVRAILALPAVARPAEHVGALLERPEQALARAVFLHHAEGVVPGPFLEALGVQPLALPAFDAAWAEILLDGLLFDEGEALGPRAGTLRARLASIGAIERRRIRLTASPRLERQLRHSPAKLRAVADIVEAEGRVLGDDLRLLVLTERIRDEAAAEGAAAEATEKVGVVPIFERLRRLRLPRVALCAVSGRVGIVPRALEADVERALAREASEASRGRALPHDSDHVRFEVADEEAAALVRVVTSALEEGRVNVVVGTVALLGEGWDAPAVNAVVLATTVGSFVTTNQSRGRALRRDPRRTRKTANIWHPVCIDGSGGEGDELALLRRRFAAFVGPALGAPVVESGLARLGLPARLDAGTADTLNAEMFRRAEDRDGMAEAWRRALVSAGAAAGRPIRETRLPPRSAPAARTLLRWRPVRSLAERVARWLEAREVTRASRAVAAALAEARAIAPPSADLAVRVDASDNRLRIRVEGLPVRDEMVLHEALQQLFCPLFAPRYLVERRGRAWVAPRALGANREGAECFLRHFRRHVGRARLVATRHPEGQRLLLAAMQRYLAAHLHDRPETGVRWVPGR